MDLTVVKIKINMASAGKARMAVSFDGDSRGLFGENIFR